MKQTFVISNRAVLKQAFFFKTETFLVQLSIFVNYLDNSVTGLYNFFFEKVSILISILIFSHNASLHLRLLYIIFIYRLLLILSSYCILCSFPCTDYLASPNLLCLSTCQTGARLCGIFNIAPLFLSIHYIVYPSLRFNIALYRVYKHFVCRAFFTLKSSFGSIKFL